MAANTTVIAMVSGAASTSLQTALSNLNTVISTLQTYPGTLVTWLNSGLNTGSDSQATAYSYVAWAFVQYQSAS